MEDNEWEDWDLAEHAEMLRGLTCPEEMEIELLFIQGLVALERYLEQF